MPEASPRPARPTLAAVSAFVLGVALALAAWQWNHVFVDSVGSAVALLGIPLALWFLPVLMGRGH